MRSQLRRLSHQAVGAVVGVQRRALRRHRRAHAAGAEVQVAAGRVRQRNDSELHHLSDLRPPMSTTEWTDAAAVDDVPADDVIGMIVAGRDLALYNAGGE